jgi:hypothetical protein
MVFDRRLCKILSSSQITALRPRAPKKRPGGTQSYDYVHFSSFDPALFHRRVITASESRGFEMQAMQAIKATFKAME